MKLPRRSEFVLAIIVIVYFLFWAYPALGAVPDNKNRFLHAPDDLGRLKLRGIYLLRGLLLFLGAGAIPAAYGIGLVLTGEAMLALMSAALVAVLPHYTYIASLASIDARRARG